MKSFAQDNPTFTVMKPVFSVRKIRKRGLLNANVGEGFIAASLRLEENAANESAIKNPAINHVTNAGQIVSPKKIAVTGEFAILAAENSTNQSAIKPEPSNTQIPYMNDVNDPPEIDGDTLFLMVNARY